VTSFLAAIVKLTTMMGSQDSGNLSSGSAYMDAFAGGVLPGFVSGTGTSERPSTYKGLNNRWIPRLGTPLHQVPLDIACWDIWRRQRECRSHMLVAAAVGSLASKWTSNSASCSKRSVWRAASRCIALGSTDWLCSGRPDSIRDVIASRRRRRLRPDVGAPDRVSARQLKMCICALTDLAVASSFGERESTRRARS